MTLKNDQEKCENLENDTTEETQLTIFEHIKVFGLVCLAVLAIYIVIANITNPFFWIFFLFSPAIALYKKYKK